MLVAIGCREGTTKIQTRSCRRAGLMSTIQNPTSPKYGKSPQGVPHPPWHRGRNPISPKSGQGHLGPPPDGHNDRKRAFVQIDDTLKSKSVLIDLTITSPYEDTFLDCSAGRNGYATREAATVKNSIYRGNST